MIDRIGNIHILVDHITRPAKVYPTLANGETVQAAAGLWALGSFKEIVPANGITEEFHLH